MFRWYSASPPERRQGRLPGIVRLFLWCCVVLLPALARAEAPLDVRELAPGVFAIQGSGGEPSPGNAGRVANTGFIVGPRGVVVIDSGANRAHGEAILAAIAARTPLPVVLLINTHPHPHNVLGNAVFAARGIPILATAMTREKMDQRCPRCLDGLYDSIGEAGMAGTRIELPGETIAAETRRTDGGLSLRLLPLGHAHTEGDLAVFDEASGTLFAGDAAYAGELPYLSEASLEGWMTALGRLAAMPARRVVPGRGAVADGSGPGRTLAYLEALRSLVKRGYDAGRSLNEVMAAAALPAFASLAGYAERHGRNVQHAYFALERQDFAGAVR